MREKPDKPLNFFAKVIFALLLFFILLKGVGLAQSITWERTYLQSVTTSGYSVKQTSDGNYIICGVKYDIGGFVCKLNPFGDTLWVRYTPFRFMQSIVESPDGNYVSISSSGVLYAVKYSPSGTKIWEKYISEPGYNLNVFNMINTSDNCLLISGDATSSGQMSAYYIKINSNGLKVWSKFISPVNSAMGLTNSCMTNDNGYILTGGININNNGQIYLIRTNSIGDTLWTRSFGSLILESGSSVFQTNDNGFIVFGNIYYSNQNVRLYFLKTDQNGNLQWSKIYGDTNTQYQMLYGEGSVKSRYNNSYYITGKSTNYPALDTNKVFILNIDSNGNVIWERKYKKDTLDIRGFGLYQTSDSGFIISGDAKFFNFNNNLLTDPQLLYVMKTNKFGEINPIGININTGSLPVDFKLHQNYPNPFNPVTNIKYEIPNDANVTIKVYDLIGREIFSMNDFKQAGGYEVQFDGTNFASGMYFYSFETPGFKETKKMVLVK